MYSSSSSSWLSCTLYRAKLEQTAPSGQLTASEQLQPLYEMKSKLMDMAAKIDQLHVSDHH